MRNRKTGTVIEIPAPFAGISLTVGISLRPAKLHDKPGTVAGPAGLVGRTPWSAADAPVGLLTPCKMLMSRDEGVPRGPGGPPHRWFFASVPGLPNGRHA